MGIEQGVQLVKQIFDLENVQALSFAGINRLALFAYLGAYTGGAVEILTPESLAMPRR